MKNFHVHLSVVAIADSIDFYNTLFGQEPSKQRTNYAKWVLETPALNFAISQVTEQGEPGLHHLGFEFDSDITLEATGNRLENTTSEQLRHQVGTTCCYAKSNKYWIDDPQGIAWENFHTLSETDDYQESAKQENGPGENCVANGCCQANNSTGHTATKSSCC